MTATRHAIAYGSEKIEFSLRHSQRKTLAITVEPDLSVIVTAPPGVSLEKIKSKVQKRASWIIRQKDHFARFLPPATSRRYVSGESYYYLGRQYRLKLEQAEKEEVRLKYGRLVVSIRDRSDAERVKELLENWLVSRARVRFRQSLETCLEKLHRYQLTPPGLRLRKMSRRWGSCTQHGIIYLNPHLIVAPSHCIDYVVMHELCHLIEANHSRRFYALLTRYMPDWEQRKQRLEQVR